MTHNEQVTNFGKCACSCHELPNQECTCGGVPWYVQSYRPWSGPVTTDQLEAALREASEPLEVLYQWYCENLDDTEPEKDETFQELENVMMRIDQLQAVG